MNPELLEPEAYNSHAAVKSKHADLAASNASKKARRGYIASASLLVFVAAWIATVILTIRQPDSLGAAVTFVIAAIAAVALLGAAVWQLVIAIKATRRKVELKRKSLAYQNQVAQGA